MATIKDKESIFESPAQHMRYDPSEIKLKGDRVLVRELPRDEKEGSIIIPETNVDREHLRWGVIVTVGPGDSHIEWADKHGLRSDGSPLIHRVPIQCRHCKGTGRHIASLPSGDVEVPCSNCRDTPGRARWPMEVKTGDRVLYDRRKEAEIFLPTKCEACGGGGINAADLVVCRPCNGLGHTEERYSIMHEEQAIILRIANEEEEG